MKFNFLLILCVLFVNPILGQDVVINEFMSSNSKTLQDWEGDFPDWIEFYNSGEEEINLEGYTLSDQVDQPYLWAMPSVILPPGSFLVVFASKKDTVVEGEIHANFKIKQDGEYLVLSNPEGEQIQTIEPVVIPQDISFSCIPDGNNEYMMKTNPTPGASNKEMYVINSSHSSGYYEDKINLELSSPNSNIEIRYTLDGSIPNATSKIYESVIVFDSDNYTLGNISQIPTNPQEGPWPLPTFIWKEPESVEKAHVLRYGVFRNGELKSEIYTQSFFMFDDLSDRYTFPVFSLVTDSLNLFQYDTGIYIPGVKFDEIGWQWYPYGNYRERGREWERNAHISFFEENGDPIFETNSGIRIRGAGSACNPQKSLGVYFRNEYGLNKIEHKLYEDSQKDKFKRIILRSSGNDMLKTHFRDAVLMELLKPLDLELQNYRPAILFINGEYWGIHGIREKFDEYYFKYHFGIPEDEISILGIALKPEEGEVLNYSEIHNYVVTHDMNTEESYSFIEERVDIPNMIDFLIAEIYYANFDWPCNNYKKWRTTEEGSKWRFFIHDLDLSFGFDSNSQWDKESLTHAFLDGDNWPNCGASNQLFRGMIKNERFVNEFVERFAWHLKNTFRTSRIIEKIDEFQELFEPEIEEHIERWRYPGSYDKWLEKIEVMKEFARKRPCFMQEHIKDYFELENFNFDCDSLNNIREYYTKDDFQIFPNPFTGNELSVRTDGANVDHFEYSLYTADGKILRNGQLNGSSTIIPVNNLVRGVYVLEITNPKYSFRYKVIKVE